VRSEDLITFGFESEFVGRLPVRAVFERLTEEDLFTILENPNNPIILGKKLDFASYGITIKFEREALRMLSRRAFEENTGARGLVSAVEKALLNFEKRMPSLNVKHLAATPEVLEKAKDWLARIEREPDLPEMRSAFEKVNTQERQSIIAYVTANKPHLSQKFGLPLTPDRIELIADYYVAHTTDINGVFDKFFHFYEEVKNIELQFLKKHGTNIVFEEDAIDALITRWRNAKADLDAIYKQLSSSLEYGLKLVREKTGRNRFFLNRQALETPEAFIAQLLKEARATAAEAPHQPDSQSE
jgi:hypothetical protein